MASQLELSILALTTAACCLLFCTVRAQGDDPTDFSNCRVNADGYEYIGQKNETRGGTKCQFWVDHKGPRSPSRGFPEGDELEYAMNYCRNPNKDPGGLWCYTSTVDDSYEYCDVPFCRPTTCRLSFAGYEYAGLKDTTRSGNKCRNWNNYSGSRSNRNSQFPDGDVNDAKNYCRNPNKDPKGPWCYTSRWLNSYEYCDIPLCPLLPIILNEVEHVFDVVNDQIYVNILDPLLPG